MDWNYYTHKASGGTTRLPDEPGVREWYEARGWTLSDEPAETPYVPPADGGQTLVESDFVTLVHSETRAKHDFPANGDAIEGAHEAGWRFPEARSTHNHETTEQETESVPDATLEGEHS